MLGFIRLFPSRARKDRESIQSEEKGEEVHQGTYWRMYCLYCYDDDDVVMKMLMVMMVMIMIMTVMMIMIDDDDVYDNTC